MDWARFFDLFHSPARRHARRADRRAHDGETDCLFVSSKGLMKLCEVYQKLPNDARRRWPRGALRRHEEGGRIYVHPMALRHFARHALPRIDTPFALVTGDGVMEVSRAALGPRTLGAILDHPHLVRWHAQNLALEDPLVEAMPIGMDCHRTWEAILLGSVPVVPETPVARLLDGLPAVVVRDWSTVTPAFLAAERARIAAAEFDFAPVMLEHWRRRLRGTPGISGMRMRYGDFMALGRADLAALARG